MSENEHKFADDLREVAKSCYPHMDASFEEGAKISIGKTIGHFDFTKDQLAENVPSDVRGMYARFFIDYLEQNTVPISGYMIASNHPFLAEWKDNEKGYFLDLAFTRDISELEKLLAFDLYLEPSSQAIISQQQEQIKSLRVKQSRLRELNPYTRGSNQTT
jgi:hypothetical protein